MCMRLWKPEVVSEDRLCCLLARAVEEQIFIDGLVQWVVAGELWADTLSQHGKRLAVEPLAPEFLASLVVGLHCFLVPHGFNCNCLEPDRLVLPWHGPILEGLVQQLLRRADKGVARQPHAGPGALLVPNAARGHLRTSQTWHEAPQLCRHNTRVHVQTQLGRQHHALQGGVNSDANDTRVQLPNEDTQRQVHDHGHYDVDLRVKEPEGEIPKNSSDNHMQSKKDIADKGPDCRQSSKSQEVPQHQQD
mmetsp:Transcript_46958/g.133997  ORF Transcript_46958/g.133997 Transcript_46958/m.133997 type:complete len:248 (+) Transcript_46958:433-1176(+)